MKHFGFGEQSFIPCEICGVRAVDIHHIVYRSRGGKNNIENLIALCRECHNKVHSESISKIYLKTIHNNFLRLTG